MAIEELLAVLAREAEAEASGLLAAAEAEATTIEREAATRADRERSAASDRLADAEARAIRRALASAERSQRERTLNARARAVDRIFAAAEARLEQLTLERWRHRAADLAADTVRFLEGRPARLECPPEAVALVEPMLAGQSSVSVRSASTAAPGILGRTEDGAVTVDNTLPERLRRQRADLAIALVARMGEISDAMG